MHTYNSYKNSVESGENPAILSVSCPIGTTVLVVFLSWNTVVERIGTPTYNGVNMSPSGQGQVYQAGGETTIECWYMLSPPTKSSYDLSVPNITGKPIFISASCYKAGTGKISEFDISASVTGNSANGNIDIEPTLDGAAIIAGLTSGFSAPPVAAETEIYTNDWGNQVFGDQYYMQVTGGIIKNMAWTISTETWEAIAIAFKEADPPSGWGHKFAGVANANISKINGIAKANINSVAGRT